VNAREKLSRTFVELADTLVRDFDVIDLLHVLTIRCVELVDVDAAGLLLIDESGMLRVAASSEERMHLLELFELQHQEGPGLDCVMSGERVVGERLTATDRWPRFASEAVSAGFNSVEAIPLRLRDDLIGALTLFRREPTALTDAESAICRALADVATIGLLQARAVSQFQAVAQQLHSALNSRVAIEQAKGVLAERGGIVMDDGFHLMREFARRHNRRLVEVAESVIAGRLPLSDLRARP
jgi:transcriptional regulator with GAF, ATPase, and Fis domain